MKENEFKYYLYQHYKIEYYNVGMWQYTITLLDHDIVVFVGCNDYTNKLLNLIIINTKDGECYYYQSFKKALDRIKLLIKKEGENNEL